MWTVQIKRRAGVLHDVQKYVHAEKVAREGGDPVAAYGTPQKVSKKYSGSFGAAASDGNGSSVNGSGSGGGCGSGGDGGNGSAASSGASGSGGADSGGADVDAGAAAVGAEKGGAVSGKKRGATDDGDNNGEAATAATGKTAKRGRGTR